jgi:hypothetical protein
MPEKRAVMPKKGEVLPSDRAVLEGWVQVSLPRITGLPCRYTEADHCNELNALRARIGAEILRAL